MARVFVSSTYEDLKGVRPVVIEQLHRERHEVLGMELFSATGRRPLDKCLAEIDRCDVCVAILAWKYGFIPRNVENPNGWSITECELRRAADQGKECLVFLLREDAPWPAKAIDRGANSASVDRLRKQVQERFTTDWFTNADDLARKVGTAIRAWEASRPMPPSGPGALPPVRESGTLLPGRFVSGTRGWLHYRRAREFRERLQRTFATGGAAESVVGPEFRIPYQARAQDATILRTSHVTFVAGPAGVGKTTFVSEALRRFATEFDLTVILSARSLVATGSAEDTIAKAVLEFFDEVLAMERVSRLTAAAVAYALRRKRLLLVIEDLHQAESSQKTMIAVRRFLEKRGRWSTTTVCATTRESVESVQKEFGKDVQIVHLQPMSQREAQEFFFLMCRENGIEQDSLVRHGEQIAAAFPGEAVRTPLFVVICAWLVTRGMASLTRVLEMTTSDVFATFIEHLYKRARGPESGYNLFLQAYQDLACRLWPKWDECRPDEIEEALQQANQKAQTNLALGFFETGGFLYRSPYRRYRLHFPHQSMADYLTAASMIRDNGFERLAGARMGRIDGLIPFLAERIEQDSTLRAIAHHKPELFFRLAEDPVFLERHAFPIQALVELVMEWVSGSAVGSRQDWERALKSLARFKGDGMRRLCQGIDSLPRVTPRGIRRVARLGGSEIVDLVIQWVDAGKHRNVLREVLEHPDVANLLEHVLRQGSAAVQKRVSRLLWSSLSALGNGALFEWARDHITEFDDTDFAAIARHGDRGMAFMARASTNRSLGTKQSISKKIARSLGKVLVHGDTYQVKDDANTNRTFKAEQPYLVPLRPDIVNGPFTSDADLRAKVTARLALRELMTKHEALVALNYYSAQLLGGDGVMFAAENDPTPEVFQNEKGELGLYVIPSNSTEIQVSSGKTSSDGSCGRAYFRRIQKLTDVGKA